jgi:xanthine dehydrogenase accessory factor
MYDEFFSKAYELTREGVPFATAIVVRAERPTSGKPGDKAIITADGVMHGWIGGSCAQPTVIREALKALRTDQSRFVRLSPNPHEQPAREGLNDVPLTCFSGGTLEIYIEPQQPQPRLMIVGDLPVARALGELSKAMSYRTIVVDLHHQGEPPRFADELLTDLTAMPGHVTPLTSIVVATHGQYDELALEQALSTNAPYIGLVASRKRAEAVRENLIQQGFTAEQLRRFKSPAGLDIQARRGDEIALSIMAEIVQRRRNIAEMVWLPAPANAIEPEAEPAPLVAIDPICGMSVTIAEAKYTYEYQGTTYYFCCPGCKTTFRKAPEHSAIAGQASPSVE